MTIDGLYGDMVIGEMATGCTALVPTNYPRQD